MRPDQSASNDHSQIPFWLHPLVQISNRRSAAAAARPSGQLVNHITAKLLRLPMQKWAPGKSVLCDFLKESDPAGSFPQDVVVTGLITRSLIPKTKKKRRRWTTGRKEGRRLRRKGKVGPFSSLRLLRPRARPINEEGRKMSHFSLAFVRSNFGPEKPFLEVFSALNPNFLP